MGCCRHQLSILGRKGTTILVVIQTLAYPARSCGVGGGGAGGTTSSLGELRLLVPRWWCEEGWNKGALISSLYFSDLLGTERALI